MEKERIYIHCLSKNSLPHKIVKILKRNGEMDFDELSRILEVDPYQLKNALYLLLPAIIEDGKLVKLNKKYDFVVTKIPPLHFQLYSKIKDYEKLEENSISLS